MKQIWERCFFCSQQPELIKEIKELNNNLKDNISIQEQFTQVMQNHTNIEVTGTTVEQLQEILANYPPKAIVHVCGSQRIFIHQFGNKISFDETELIE